MDPYHKIQSIYKRDERGRFLDGQFSDPVFGYLFDTDWEFTEKVDGTNIRLGYEPTFFTGNEHAYIAGRSDNAQIPPILFERLMELMKTMPLADVFDTGGVTLYGEGYGAKIQKGGGNYHADHCDFVLFDVKVGDNWLQRADVNGIAEALGLDVVPIIGRGTLGQAMKDVAAGFNSTWGDFPAEGVVARPTVELQTRRGARIITKIKTKDFA